MTKQQTNTIQEIIEKYKSKVKSYEFDVDEGGMVDYWKIEKFFETEITGLLKSLRMEERKYVSKEGYRHGTCCTCSTCGFDNDSCECDYNEIVKCFNQKLRSIMGETLQE